MKKIEREILLKKWRNSQMANETKSIKVNAEQKTKVVEVMSHFAWKAVGTSNPSGNEYTLSFQRDTKMPNYKRIVSLEKQYNKINRHFPLTAIILLAISLLMLIPLFVVNEITAKSILAALTSVIFSIGLFLLFSFLFMLTKKKSMLNDLLHQADELRGATFDIPLPCNIKEPTKDTHEIKNSNIQLGKKVNK